MGESGTIFLFVLAKSELKFKTSDHENHCIFLELFFLKKIS